MKLGKCRRCEFLNLNLWLKWFFIFLTNNEREEQQQRQQQKWKLNLRIINRINNIQHSNNWHKWMRINVERYFILVKMQQQRNWQLWKWKQSHVMDNSFIKVELAAFVFWIGIDYFGGVGFEILLGLWCLIWACDWFISQ